MKIVVLGAGTVGTASAWHLAEASHEVTVVERQLAPALETSWGNGCVLHASEVEPWSAPGMPRKIFGWLGREDAPLLLRYGAVPHMWRWGLDFMRNCTAEKFRAHSRANLDLALLSLRRVQELQEGLEIDCDRSSRGVLKIFRDEAALDGAEASSNYLSQHGLLYERITVNRAVEIEPALADTASTLKGALYFERDEVADCNKFTTGLARAAEERGVTLRFHTHVEAIHRKNGKVSGVQTSQGFIPAEAVVVAMGSYTPNVLAKLGIRAAIYPVKGVSITLPREDWNRAPSRPVIDDSKLFGFVPIGNRLRVSGSAEITNFDTAPVSARANAILDNACFTFPGLRQQYDPVKSRVWAGLRPVTPKGIPMIGQTTVPGVWINAGHGHLGWTLSVGSGKALAGLMSGADTGLKDETVRILAP